MVKCHLDINELSLIPYYLYHNINKKLEKKYHRLNSFPNKTTVNLNHHIVTHTEIIKFCKEPSIHGKNGHREEAEQGTEEHRLQSRQPGVLGHDLLACNLHQSLNLSFSDAICKMAMIVTHS